jgi:hypothetical protein
MVGTVQSARQPAASAMTERIREHAQASRPQTAAQSRAAAQEKPDTRTEKGVPAWKRRLLDTLATQLEHRGASRGSRVQEGVTAENIDSRITKLAAELKTRPAPHVGYPTAATPRTGTVVNRVV